MTEAMLAIMHAADVVCVDAYEVARRVKFRRLDSWELKPFAIANCSFEQLLYLDADNVPVQDPAPLFNSFEFDQTGAIFWPDRYTGVNAAQEWLKRSAWDICGVPFRVEPECESGQLLIDKRKCWPALMLCLHINERSDFYYAHFYGDKDTCRLAWHRMDVPFTLVPYPVRTLGESDVIVQHDFDGKALFQHRNGDKFSLSRRPRHVRGFRNAEACEQLLSELSRRWHPPVRSLPADFARAEADAYAAVCAIGWFSYSVEGQKPRMLELRPDFSIGRGRGTMEFGWMIEEDKDGEAVLSIRNAHGPTCFLRLHDDGVWRGRWRVYERGRVSVRPGAQALADRDVDCSEGALRDPQFVKSLGCALRKCWRVVTGG